MAPHGGVISFLVLVLVLVTHQQQEDSGSDGDCEEAWDYVHFMKTDLSEKVEDILTTLYDEKTRRSPTGLDEVMSSTMRKVMEVRESLLQRINDIRKNKIEICTEQNIRQEKVLTEFRIEIMDIILKLISKDGASMIKSISSKLLRFKTLVGQEIMRMLMLPQHRANLPLSDEDCSECELLKHLGFIMENLWVCADKEERNEDDDDNEEAMNNFNEQEPGKNCKPPNMYSMDIITAMEAIDSEIGNIYYRLITTTDENTRQYHFQMLEFYKQLRDAMNEILQKLVTDDEEGNLKKVVKRNAKSISSALKTIFKECQSRCGQPSCDSCAAQIIYDSITKMNYFKSFFKSYKDKEEEREYVRNDIIKYITENNEETRDILISRAKTGSVDDCDSERLGVFGKLKGPMWMLVNTTIFSDMTEVETMVNAMAEELEILMTEYCGPEELTGKQRLDGPNCDWEEHEQTQNYLTKIDDIIENALFKTSDDSDRTIALLGFVNIQDMLDKRVKKLFLDKLVCPEEVKILKQKYMSQLNKCMAQLMNRNMKFSEMSRSQRMSCIRGLRDSMENRMSRLLQREVQKSLSKINA